MGEGRNRNKPCTCGSGRKFKKCCIGKQVWPFPKKGELSEKEKAILLSIIDSVTDEYLNNHQVVFANESERKQAHFAYVKMRKKSWEKSSCCMFPGCGLQSIKRSHTIPQSSLSLIAENGHVLTPSFNQNIGSIELKKTGIGQSSVFPGFCSEHEQIFQAFEAKRIMSDPTDFILQVFRTVCREIAIKEHQIKYLYNLIEDFKTRREEWATKRVTEELSKRFLISENINVKKITIETNDILQELEKRLKKLEEDKVQFKSYLFDPFAKGFATGTISIPVIHYNLPHRLPIALSGRGNFFFKEQVNSSVKKEIIVILNVIPTQSGTDIFIAAPDGDMNALKTYFVSFTKNAKDEEEYERILSMLESWMLNGSDHWFITPSAWDFLTDEQRQSVLSLISEESYNIGYLPKEPVLNMARKKPNKIVVAPQIK